MSIFHLPDLGEGLPDAEVHEWFVKVGDEVKTDDPLVSMETAKAVVDVPAPQTGKIIKLHGAPGDIIQTGAPLVEFEGAESKGEEKVATETPATKKDAGTVVGAIESSGKVFKEKASNVGGGAKATPAVRALAKKLKVDLSQVNASGPNGTVTLKDVENFQSTGTDTSDFEPLKGVRRTMATVMATSHAQVVPVTIYDDADIHAWKPEEDISARIIRALWVACQEEPALNAWFDTKSNGRKLHDTLNLGLAIDTEEGLFVPVIKDAGSQSPKALRESINNLKEAVKNRSIPPDQLHGATITLSNFGTFAGKYASPIIVPPTVAIIATGRIKEEVVPHNNQPTIHKILPLSLTFDHRAVTGGEAARFLGLMMRDLGAAS